MSFAADDRLGDLGPFQPLYEIADHFRVEIRVVGGAAVRLAADLMHDRVGALITDYCPFATTIELVHTGPNVLTPLIKEAVDYVAPFAPWCPIEVKGEFRDRAHRGSRAVPLTGMSFSTKHGLQGRHRGFADLQNGSVSFDQRFVDALEDPAALNHLPRVILDALSAACDLRGGRLSQTALAVFRSDLLQRYSSEAMPRDERVRFIRQLADVTVRASPEMAEHAQLLWNWLGGGSTSWARQLRSDQAAVVPSFDTPILRKLPEQVAFDADQTTARTLKALECSLDPSFEVLRITEPMHFDLRRGLGPWAREGTREKTFMCLAWREPSSRRVNAAALLPTAAADPVTIGVSDGGTFKNGNSWVRLDVSGLVRSESQSFRIACMASAEPEARGEEWDPLKPLGADWTRQGVQIEQERLITSADLAQAAQASQFRPSHEFKATTARRLVETTDGRVVEAP